MAHYIDADRLRAEIERLKNHSEESKKEWIGEGYNQNAFAEDCRIKSFDKLISFIDSLQQEQLSIPSNLDEAAKDRVTENGRFELTAFEKMRIEDIRFGAEWMAQQEQPDKDKKTFDDYLKVSPSERRKMNITEILGEEKLAETKKQMEQPEVNFEKELEEEIERFYRTDEYRIADALGRGFETLARHFAEWGAEHARKEDK